MRFEVLKRDAEIERLEAVLAGADPQAAAKLRDRRWAQLDDDFAFVAKCNEGGESMEDVQLARLKTIAARGWLRTLDEARKSVVKGKSEPVRVDRGGRRIYQHNTLHVPHPDTILIP